MTSFLPIINHIIALGVIVLQIGVVITLYFLFQKKESAWLSFVSRHSLHIGFFVSLASVLLSLFYSNIIGYAPCTLCWWQRIFMYPQAILFGMALYKKDGGVFRYALMLSCIGIIFSMYHYYIELGGSPLIPCGVAVSCAKRYIFEFQ